MEEQLGCLCISAGPLDTSNHAATNIAVIDPIFTFFQLSCPPSKFAKTQDSINRPLSSVAFWEYMVKSLGVSSSMPSRPSDDAITTQEIPVTDLKPATIWIPDSEVMDCQTCMKAFSFLVRKHHCRLCGRVVCGECSKYRMVLEKTNKPVRVCCTCFFGHMNDSTNDIHSLCIDTTRMISTTQITTPLSKDDFHLLKVIGKGSFGKVLLVRNKRDKRVYALKILMKSRVLARKQVEHTKSERKILEEINHPFLSRLEFAFQTEGKLYIGMEFLAGGPLFYHLQQVL